GTTVAAEARRGRARVPDDADDEPRCVSLPKGDAQVETGDVLSREEAADEFLVHDRDGLRTRLVGVGERTPLDDGEPQRLDVAWRDVADVGVPAWLVGRGPFDASESHVQQSRVR